MGEVAGTSKKPWRQKGTGRARAGSFQSPLWRGGGVVFGPSPATSARRSTHKTKQLALRKALSERLKAGDVIVVDDLKLGSPKTKELRRPSWRRWSSTAPRWSWLPTSDKNLMLASRNVPDVELTTSDMPQHLPGAAPTNSLHPGRVRETRSPPARKTNRHERF